MVDKRPHAVYRRLMISHGHGYPFWVPEIDQSLPLPYRQNGMKPGDLIILNSDGGYSYLFNIEVPADDPVNNNRVPPGFEPLQVETPPRVFPLFHNKSSVVTAFDEFTRSFDIEASAELPTLAGAGVSFGISTSKAEEAILMLPDGATRYDISNERIYEDYAGKYAQVWFDFVENKLGKRLPTSSLYLVTGCDKSPSWGAAVIHNPTDSGHCSLNFTVGGVAGGGISYSMSEKTQRGPNVRSFPPAGLIPSDPVQENQCVFARGLTITTRRSFLKSKVSGIVISWIDGSSNDTCPSFRSSNSSGSSSSHSPTSWFSRRSDSGSPSSSGSKRTTSTGHTDVEDLPISFDSDTDSEPASDESADQIGPEWSWNPSTHVSQWMLGKCPDASIAIVSDRVWMSDVRDTPEWTVDDIVDKVMATHDLVMNGILVALVHKESIPNLPYPQHIPISHHSAGFVQNMSAADATDLHRASHSHAHSDTTVGEDNSLLTDGIVGVPFRRLKSLHGSSRPFTMSSHVASSSSLPVNRLFQKGYGMQATKATAYLEEVQELSQRHRRDISADSVVTKLRYCKEKYGPQHEFLMAYASYRVNGKVFPEYSVVLKVSHAVDEKVPSKGEGMKQPRRPFSILSTSRVVSSSAHDFNAKDSIAIYPGVIENSEANMHYAEMDSLDIETSPFCFEQLVSLVDYAMTMSATHRPQIDNCFNLTKWIWNAVAELGAGYLEAIRPVGKVKILRWKHRLVAKGAVGQYLFEDQAVSPEHLEAHLDKWQEWLRKFNAFQQET